MLVIRFYSFKWRFEQITVREIVGGWQRLVLPFKENYLRLVFTIIKAAIASD